MIYIIRPKPSRLLSAYIPSLGISLLSAALKKEHLPVTFIDTTFEPDFLSIIESNGFPKVIMLSLYIDNSKNGIEIIDQIKNVYQQITVMVGGPHITLLGKKAFNLSQNINYICIGDCIPQVVQVVKDIYHQTYKNTRGIVRSENNFSYPNIMPDFSIFNSNKYFQIFPIEFANGCLQKCPYCNEHVLKQFFIRSLSDVISEIKYVCENYAAKYFRFVDSSLTNLGNDFECLLNLIIENNLNIHWSGYTNIEKIRPVFVPILKKSGCIALYFGIETLSPKVTSGKNHAKNLDHIRSIIDLLKKYDISTHCNFIIGLPGETKSTIEETLRNILEIAPDSVNAGIFYLTPNSTFHNHLEQYDIKIIDKDWIEKQHITYHDPNYNYYQTNTLTQPEMRKLLSKFKEVIEGTPNICWNMSDFAILAFLSIGGNVNQLKYLWKSAEKKMVHNYSIILQS
ncbi:MAG: radical SAM protein [Candidatus Marinimicrobia bacterium]|nr:radical SAM protein [Candidatus Neomarinimicrobiota bacterium]